MIYKQASGNQSLEIKQLVHQPGGVLVSAVIALTGGPAGEADFLERLAYLGPVNITFTEFAEAAFHTPVLDVELDGALAEFSDPLVRRCKSLHIADVEIDPNPRAIDLINIATERLRGFTESVPDGFNEDLDAQLAGQRNGLTYLRDGALPDVVVGFIWSGDFTGNE